MSGFDANALLNNEPAHVNGPASVIPARIPSGTFNANVLLGNESSIGSSADIDQQLASYDKLQSTYGTLPQQLLTGIEGAAQGFAGPVATGAEAALSAAGVPGLSPHEQEMRAKANPLTRYSTEAGAFGASALTGVGEARLAAEAGKLAAKNIGKATVASRLLAGGIKTGAEIAALQSGSELSKLINQDPNQTIGSAAVNVGLAGLLGGVAGVGLGAVSELWKAGADKTANLLTDAKERIAYRQHLEAGVDVPSFEEAGVKETIGHKLGDYLFEKGQSLPNRVGDLAGEAIGGGLGTLVGHPLIGAHIGRKHIGPVIESIAKPLLEGVTNAEGFKSAVDYVANAAKGTELINKAVDSVIKSTEVLPNHLIPTQASRDKLQENLMALDSPDKILQSGGQLGHYMPQHLAAATALISQAKNTLDMKKPSNQAASPWVGTVLLTPLQKDKYNRSLDIAQQPLMVLKYAKDGTLTNSDIATLNNIYPGLAKAFSDKLGSKIVEAKSNGIAVPYHVRTAMSKLAGVNLDASQSPSNMQAIMMSAAPQQHTNKTSAGRNLPHGHTTAAQLKAIDQTNKLYSTRSQARELANDSTKN